MKRLFTALVTFGAIFILSEGTITELNSVVGRSKTIDALYREARKASEKTNNAKKDSKLNMKTTTPITAVKKEDEMPVIAVKKEDEMPIIAVKKEDEMPIIAVKKEDEIPIIAVKKENELVIDQKTKEAICNTIMERATEFGGDIFRGFGEVFQAIREIMPPEYELKGWTPLGVKILAFHLRDNDMAVEMGKDMLGEIQEKVTSKEAGRPPFKKTTKVDSGYRSVTVYTPLGEKFSEDVITCPRVIANNELGIYYVSKEYNINFAPDSLANPIAARFIFHENHTSGRMDLIAIAEEPAQPLIDLDSEKDIEEIYFERRKGKEPATFRSQDPICQFEERELFRMCSQIFTSKYFANKVTFPASYSVVSEHECEENVVKFRKPKEGDKTIYSEWMAVCYMGYHPFGYRPQEKLTFYVSRAYNSDTNGKASLNEVFVYNVEKGDIFPMNLFSNAGMRTSKENSKNESSL